MSEKKEKTPRGFLIPLIFVLLLLYLLANFCRDGKPLYRYILPEREKPILEKALEKSEEIVNKVTHKPTSVIPKEDQESLKKLIEQKSKEHDE